MRTAAPYETHAPDIQTGTVRFIGNATVLLQYHGFSLLTDPNFLHRGEQVRLGHGLRSTRLTEPALNIDELPPLDVVLLSHLHEDHFDRVAEQRLDKDVPIVTTPQAATLLTPKGFKTVPLDTWQTQTYRKGEARLRIMALPARHGPPVVSRFLPSTMGSLVELEPVSGGKPLRVYVSGDTLVHDDLYEIPRRFPDIDLALLHLGGTRILGILLTMDGAQGVEAMQIVAPRLTIPIHYDDYSVFTSPLEDFQQAVAQAGLTGRVRYLKRGEAYAIPSAAVTARA